MYTNSSIIELPHEPKGGEFVVDLISLIKNANFAPNEDSMKGVAEFHCNIPSKKSMMDKPLCKIYHFQREAFYDDVLPGCEHVYPPNYRWYVKDRKVSIKIFVISCDIEILKKVKLKVYPSWKLIGEE